LNGRAFAFQAEEPFAGLDGGAAGGVFAVHP
jgi:hypothetical protein